MSSAVAASQEAPRLSADAAASLAARGWAVVDEFFAPEFAEILRDEMVALAAMGKMLPNKTYFANPAGGRFLFSKPHVFEVDLHQEDINTDAMPGLKRWFELSSSKWAECLQQALPSWELLAGNDARTVKLQWNRGTPAGGGSFPAHYDNPGPPSKRALTCIVYLNPEWKEGDGGEIVLRPFLEQPIRVPPKMNRAVLFASDWVLHSVQPSLAERFCITTWMDGDGVNLPEHLTLRLPPTAMQDLEGTAAMLRRSPCQRLLSRAVDREVYEATLIACMTGAKGLEEMWTAHRQHVEASRANAPLWRLVEALRKHRQRKHAEWLRGKDRSSSKAAGGAAGGGASQGAEHDGGDGIGGGSSSSAGAEEEASAAAAAAAARVADEAAALWEPELLDCC